MKENSLASHLLHRLKTRASICGAEVTGLGGIFMLRGAANGFVLSCLDWEKEATHSLFQNTPELSPAPCFFETLHPWAGGGGCRPVVSVPAPPGNRRSTCMWGTGSCTKTAFCGQSQGSPLGASDRLDPLRPHHCRPESLAATQVFSFLPCPLFLSPS